VRIYWDQWDNKWRAYQSKWGVIRRMDRACQTEELCREEAYKCFVVYYPLTVAS
jgi:hypothetical protein